MVENNFDTLITALITAQSIIVAVVVIWKQYWMAIYNLYQENNKAKGFRYNYIWHISLFASILTWAAIAAIVSVVLFIMTIMYYSSTVSSYLFGLGLGCSIFSTVVILIVMLFSAIPTWTKARDNLEWTATRVSGKKKIHKLLLWLLIFDVEFPKVNKQIKEAVNQIKYRLIIFALLCLSLGIFLPSAIFYIYSAWILLIPIGVGIILLITMAIFKKCSKTSYK